ncbi:MAG TPA: hypothetical protein VF796_15830 [Humisphaera sp.]
MPFRPAAVAALLLACLAPAARAADRDPYGGWTKLTGKKTGFFRLEEIRGHWWFVTPDGNAFYSKGVNSVNQADKDADAKATKDADEDRWAARVAADLRNLGVNTAGCWSTGAVGKHALAWTPRPHLSFARDGLPDVFAPDWADKVKAAALAQCGPLKDDPWVLGYFTDNELSWGHEDEHAAVLDHYLKLPDGSGGRAKAEAFVKKHGKGKAAEFRAMVAKEYFKVTAEAIRAADPNHLILGCRFAGRPPMDVVKAMKGHADVISINNYSGKPPTDLLKEMHKATGLPVMVTEWSVKAKDSGPLTAHGSGPVVATQADRAARFKDYTSDLADLNYCVGFHWFRYRDHPGSNQGLVKATGEPWEKLAAAFRDLNPTLDARHAK